jgi:threonine/homoserine/homoserine lactone efflux protein
MNAQGLLIAADATQLVAVFLLYINPDQILPLASILGTIVGVLLMWWHRLVALLRTARRRLSRKAQPAAETASPIKPGLAAQEAGAPNSGE